MIDQMLKNAFPVEFGLRPDEVVVCKTTYNKPFTLSDKKACKACKTNPKRILQQDCNEEILKVDNNGLAIDVIAFEEYIEQFVGTAANVTDRCDYILTDNGPVHNKIVFCDLCCHEEKYVEPNTGNAYPQGKRAKARQQMQRSVEVLLQESLTKVNLLTYPEKVFLFAWREYGVPAIPVVAERGNAIDNIGAMMMTASHFSKQTTTHHHKAGHGFTFMQIKHPSVYIW